MFGIKKAIKDTQVKKLIQSVDYSISILQTQQEKEGKKTEEFAKLEIGIHIFQEMKKNLLLGK